MESGWLVANALLTNEERCRRHLTVDSARVRYGESHENRDHVLRNCGLATKVWCRFGHLWMPFGIVLYKVAIWLLIYLVFEVYRYWRCFFIDQMGPSTSWVL
ncbi:uncharacterized protein LOC109813196 isoform X1 [Cajanus cajan]|uniref:uncharacterized protein LOC109813196 isoform X1 n=1 Tax=Cajanus cajan TaxID=3821 RepID=UPI00098DC978|nr:uncharacterized protein LOC109813196 isoform X1 [Cajanus cajan]